VETEIVGSVARFAARVPAASAKPQDVVKSD